MITRVQVNGYRLLDGFDADLGRLTVVIGANASGKSTLIDFLQLSADCLHFPLQEAVDDHGGVLSFSSASNSDMKFYWAIELHEPGAVSTTPRTRLLTYEVNMQGRPTGQVVPVYEVLRTSEPLDKQYDTPFKYMEADQSRTMVYDFREHGLVPLEEVIRGGSRSQPPLPGLEVEPEEGTEASGGVEEESSLQLRQMRFPGHKVFGLASRVRLALIRIAFYPGFSVGRGSDLRAKPAAIRPETFLWPDGANLGTVLHEMLTRYDFLPSGKQLKEFLASAYPSFADISAETAYGSTPAILVRVQEKGMRRAMEVWDLSDGMLRFLCLGAALLNPVPPALIAIDEPEAGLHPRLMPIVADMIRAASEKTQVLVTTHSPDLLNCFALSDVAVMTREGPQAKWYRPDSRKSLRTMLDSVEGETLGELHRTGELEAIAE